MPSRVHKASRTQFLQTTSLEKTEVEKWIEIWLSQSQLAGPLYYNNEEDAAVAVKGNTLRLHEEMAMRIAGKVQYEHWVLNAEFNKSRGDKNELSGSCHVDNTIATKVQDEMRITRSLTRRKSSTMVWTVALEKTA